MELALGLGDTVLAGQAMNNIGILHGMQGDDAEAASWFRRTADIAEQAGVLRLLGKACGNLGIVAMQRSDYVAARDYLQRDIGISRTIGDRQGVADGLSNLGRLHLELGDREQARRCIAEYIAIAEQLGDRYGIAYGTDSLGQVRERCGDAAGAEACYLRAVGIYRQMQAGYDLVPALLRLTDLYAEQGRAAEVGPLLAEARALVDGRGADARQTILLRISECKLQGLTEPTAAGRALEELLGTDLDDPARARAWFELQAITGDDGHRREALRRYQALHATAPRDEYRVRIQMLGGSTRIEQ
jgi:tetratricopeptide (TPR) repeat protein